MTAATTVRPATDEYFEYFHRYVSLVPDGDIVEILRNQVEETVSFLSKLTEEDGAFRYEPGKWSLKESLGHLIDAERIFAYRALCIARNDKTPLPGFEQDDYVKFGSFDDCSLACQVAEFQAVREATEYLFEHLSHEAWTRRGVASEHDISVRAIAYIIAGHELHHLNLFRTKYFPSK